MILIPRNIENRTKRSVQLDNKRIQQYIKNGSIGDLTLCDSKLTKLPSNLIIVNGNLDIRFSNIIELPNNLTVNGWLNVKLSKIIKLPDNLTVNGNVHLTTTNVTELPKNLKVLGFIYNNY